MAQNENVVAQAHEPTSTVTIHAPGINEIVTLDPRAIEAIRLNFNPSNLKNVTKLKMLAAAFLSECFSQQDANSKAGREFAVALTNMQTASMWSVLGATKGL